MVKDTLVGVLGAVLIVGSMVAAIDYQDVPDVEDDGTGGPPAPIGKSVWRASSCEAGSVYWTPSLGDLDEVVGPHLTPAEGPLPDRGLFWLFVFECSSSAVDGLRVTPPSGGAALVAVEEPEDTHNVTAPDGWAAVPTWYGSPDSRVTGIFQKHEFHHTPAQTALGSSSTPLSDQVRLQIDAPEGTFQADLTLTGDARERVVDGALVGTDEDTFSVFSGEERMQRRSDGTARIQTTGTTWVERLDLDPTPFSISYDTQMAWNFTFQHEPWQTEDNGTDVEQGSASDVERRASWDALAEAWLGGAARR